jgi:hypothetical protein
VCPYPAALNTHALKVQEALVVRSLVELGDRSLAQGVRFRVQLIPGSLKRRQRAALRRRFVKRTGFRRSPIVVWARLSPVIFSTYRRTNRRSLRFFSS